MSRVLPILFNTDMVRAILDGRKTVTRRKIKDCNIHDGQEINKNLNGQFELYNVTPRCGIPQNVFFYPEYHIGDILYVRETWFYECHMEDATTGKPDLPSGRYSHRCIYEADDPDYPVSVGVGGTGWQPPGTMPKEAARIWLKVKDVRAERLQDMTLDDFLAEGVGLNPEAYNDPENAYGQAKSVFTEIWNSTIKKSDQDLYSWDANPWVWVIEFERCEKPEE